MSRWFSEKLIENHINALNTFDDNATPEIFQQIFGEHVYKHLWEKYTRMGGFICTVYRYLTAHGHDTTVSLTLYEDSDTRNLLWLIDQYAREAVMAKN